MRFWEVPKSVSVTTALRLIHALMFWVPSNQTKVATAGGGAALQFDSIEIGLAQALARA